jgi:hypothetical protein
MRCGIWGDAGAARAYAKNHSGIISFVLQGIRMCVDSASEVMKAAGLIV